MNNELRMAELLCTRLCHDLTGPIGAVNNGAEFLSEEGFNMQSQAMELIISSSFSAVTRLQFYRNAYGRVKEGGEANIADKQKLAMDYFAGSKITLDWPDNHTDSANISISQKMARLICNMLIIASGTLIRGGTIGVRLKHDTASRTKRVMLTISGAGIKWEKEITTILSGDHAAIEMDAKNVQWFLTRMYADELGAKITHNLEEETLRIEVIQPVE